MDKKVRKLPPIESINLNYVRNLIDQGLIADINTQIEDENLPMTQPTLLHISIYNMDEELFDYLIEKNADINKSFETYGSPLFLAVIKSSSNLNILRKLIERGAKINVRELLHYLTPLHLACIYGKCEVAELLINCGADINLSNLYYMKDPTVNMGITPLQIAIQSNHIQMVELLCRKNVNVNLESISQGTPLVSAILQGRIDIFKILVNYDADVNKISKIRTIRDTALSFDVIEEVSLTPLHAAIRNQQQRALRILLFNSEININMMTKKFKTPLHYAIKVAPSLITDLLNAGADINICINNKTIIEYCIENNASKEVIEEINQHIVKLRAAKLYVNNKIILTDNYSELNYMCLEELELMKRTRVGTNTITVYDAFGCLNDLSYKITKLDGLFIFDPKFSMVFPIYAEIVQFRMLRAIQKNYLMTRKLKNLLPFFYYIVFNSMLPLKFIQKVLHYLSSDDLNKLHRLLVNEMKHN